MNPKQILLAACCCMLLATEAGFGGGTIGRTIGVNCSACHGPSGSNAISSLYGLSARRIESALLAYKSGKRPATIMDRIARGYSENEIAAIAAYFANLK